MNALREAQLQAHAAWKACPEKNRAEKARLAAVLDLAAKAYAAAKRAEQPAPAARTEILSEVAAAANARSAARDQEEELRRQVMRAAKMFAAAQEWPRMGEDWPSGKAEEAAAKLLHNNPALAESILGQE